MRSHGWSSWFSPASMWRCLSPELAVFPRPVCLSLLPRFSQEETVLRLRQYDDRRGISNAMRRTRTLRDARRSNRKYIQLTCSPADRIDVVGIVPEHLVHLIIGKQSGVFGDGTRAVEVKHLEP